MSVLGLGCFIIILCGVYLAFCDVLYNCPPPIKGSRSVPSNCIAEEKEDLGTVLSLCSLEDLSKIAFSLVAT